MSEETLKSGVRGVPSYTPTDLPMPPYRFQSDDSSRKRDDNGTSKQAADILRSARLLGCSAASAPRR